MARQRRVERGVGGVGQMDGLCLWPVVELSCWSSPRLGWRWRGRCLRWPGWHGPGCRPAWAEVILLPPLHSAAANRVLWHYHPSSVGAASCMNDSHLRTVFRYAGCRIQHACSMRCRRSLFAGEERGRRHPIQACLRSGRRASSFLVGCSRAVSKR